MDEQRYEKAKSIQIFETRVNALKLKQSNGAREKEMLGLLEDERDRYGEYFSYLSTSFKNMIQDMEQKQIVEQDSNLEYAQTEVMSLVIIKNVDKNNKYKVTYMTQTRTTSKSQLNYQSITLEHHETIQYQNLVFQLFMA